MIYAIRDCGQNCQSMRKMWTLTWLKIVESWKNTPNTIIYLTAGKYRRSAKISKDLGMQIPKACFCMFIFFYLCACVGVSACHMYAPDYRSQKGCWSPRRLWVLGTQFRWFSKSRKRLHIEPCVPSLQPVDKPVYLIFKAFGISNKENVHG